MGKQIFPIWIVSLKPRERHFPLTHRITVYATMGTGVIVPYVDRFKTATT